MAEIDKLIKYEDFYNITLKNMYEMVTTILHDFHFAVHRSIQDNQGKRRIEAWRSSKDENDNALIWIEISADGEELDPFISTDVLRTMNEENLSKLFFFSNGSLEQKTREILDSQDHYIFLPTDIMETINALEKRKKYKHQKKRRAKGVPSGYTVLRNYLKGKPVETGRINVPVGKIQDIAEKYAKLTRKTLEEIDVLEDINNITPEIKERFKRVQHELLPEVLKISVLSFPDKFSEMRGRLFSLVQYLLVYVGSVIEYESEDEMKSSRARVEEELAFLDNIEESIAEYRDSLHIKAEKTAKKLLYLSIGIIVFFLTFLLIMLFD
jgi:hypothetical protein